ncbi:MAG: VWA domain-containing protein [Gammaproteobacteria bacterium]|nr:VWA domain-containing protein [Rhodocyclaceae bacterium]MBU3910500.1 VWA domain-containing protein [Gammaproteobacteria bacterium]MBU3989598.1 VWA domain-containing protein [Gammaproteobacteria bacterium]MBU4004981.1 VWA domain-containing protein [Gammaproteobacteria bacterium]MBU4020574.1 VWA domain-containing protein [Gammaproteobacteria bacterium]
MVVTVSERRLFEHELEERLDVLLFASSSHRKLGKLAADLEALPRQQQDLVLHLAGVASQTYAEIGHMVATLAPQALERLDAAGFESWVITALDAYDREGLRPAMESLRDLDGFVAVRAGRRPVRFVEVEQRLGRFVHGLSGRHLSLKVGTYPWTDTEAIYLPERIAHSTVTEDNRLLYTGLAVQMWAQTRYGTFNIDLEAELARWPGREIALNWLAVLEAMRLEACILRDLPGLGKMLVALHDTWPEELHAAWSDLQSPDADVGVTLAWLARFMAQDAVPPAPTFVPRLNPAAAALARNERIARETEVLRRALGALKGTAGRKPATPSEFAAQLKTETGEVEIQLDGEAVTLPPDAKAAAQSLLQDLGELPPEALTPAGDGLWNPSGQDLGLPEQISNRAADFRYDEWDYHRNAYRRKWCHVYVNEVTPGDGQFVRDVKTRFAPHIQQIKRRFEAVRGEDRILGRQQDGEEIDVDALVEAVNDRKSGAEPSTRLFCRRVRNERSLAAMFMIDMSGSTKGWVNDAEREALVMLCEALEKLGDAYAIYGFSGWTRTRCDIYRIKSFADPYDDAVRARIDAIEAKDYTRMGVAIRHLSHLLSAQPARHKLLVTLSDGRPDDFGDEYRGQYGIEDTRRALQEAREQGIRSYCITIDRHGADYLRHMVGPASYTVLDDAKKLPLKVAEIYRKLTA